METNNDPKTNTNPGIGCLIISGLWCSIAVISLVSGVVIEGESFIKNELLSDCDDCAYIFTIQDIRTPFILLIVSFIIYLFGKNKTG